ncbi:alpha/beta hydrolase [Cyanothece sp. BG0011]|uniref:alpha/beta hydrolase n=1 Tax=Cyanothece sp. BG0011 TaxID=2082950 RepID=UPI001E54309E|nr:alpha/beta hydrolase [Cyanothece sp. BG0011]
MMATPNVIPTLQQVNQCQQKIDAYITSIDENPERRDGAYPYYQFHEPEKPIYGTVIMFHGFSSKPDQMWRLSDYLYRNGFNVYQATLAGHALVNPHKNWPQIDLKPEYKKPLLEAVNQDPLLSRFLSNLEGQSQPLSSLQKLAIFRRVLKLNPFVLRDIIEALSSHSDPDFEKYFISSHMDYLNDARQRLEDIAAMPGDVYTVGLSVGGSVALALGADQPERVKKVVAYAPLLNPVEDQGQEWQISLIGTLDIQETGWDPNLQFPLGCISATNRFGDFLLAEETIAQLKQISTFLVLTENEDAAHLPTSQAFFQDIGGESQGHRSFLYDQGDLVPHPMVSPTEVSQGMTNSFWQSLYQETYRFLTTGEIVPSNMDTVEQGTDLPSVPPV